ncbi:MAG: hypothetical protein K6E59_01965 [Bacilli bacterium]|nr:hypothetical protein [Bacilli bacterium]
MVPSYNVSYSYAAMIIVGALLAIVLIEYSRTKLVNNRFKCFLIACLAMFGLNVATAFTNALHESIPYAVNMALKGHSFRVGPIPEATPSNWVYPNKSRNGSILPGSSMTSAKSASPKPF